MADPAAIFEAATRIVTDGVQSALDGKSPNLVALVPADMAAARADLVELEARARAISSAGDPAAWVSALEQWRAKLADLAAHAFGGTAPAEAMLVRALQERLPRLAALLVVTGVILTPSQGPARVDWVKLRLLATDPGTLVNEAFWDALLGDAGLPGTGRLPAVIVGLLILFPQTLLALVEGDLEMAPLEAPSPQGPGPWQDFRTASAGWISVTVPLPDLAKPDADQVPRTMYDLVADLIPQLSATLGIRSDRRLASGRAVTDFEMWLALALDQDKWQYDFGSYWILRVVPGITVGFGHDDAGWHGAFRAVSMADLPHPLGPDDPLVVTFGREPPGGAPDVALGPPYDTRLVINDLGAYLKLREDHPIVEVGVFVHQFSVVLTNRWWRTFGATNETFGEGIRFDLSLDAALVEGKGVELNLAAGLDVTFDLNWTALGGRPPAVNTGAPGGSKPRAFDLTIYSVRVHVPIEATQDAFNIRVEALVHASLRIGPVLVAVDGLGGWVGWWDEGTPPERHHIGFLPPTGAAVQLQLTGVAGGGFLDFTGGPNDHFAGLLYLRINAFEVTAFGIHELTGQPSDSQRATSFIMVIGVRFSPGIQLGYGFAITGFGGLVGINRRADTDALRERLTSGAAGNVLFAEDPVRNAPEILGDLGTLFPPADGVYVFGPTIQISWLNVGAGKLVRFDVGIFIELPGPSKVVLLGSARASIPGDTDNKIFFIRIDIVGLIDFPKKILEFDATLISSHVLEVFKVTGDAAFRASWGDRPYVMLALGGFHPDFNPEPAIFPEMTRVALTMQSDSGVFLRGEAYFAATTNTLQFGGRIEAGVYAGPVNAIGFISLDALIQFVPFHFQVDFSAGFEVRYHAVHLGGVKISGTISGPGPLVLAASFTIDFLFFSISWSDSFTLGSTPTPAPVAVSSIAQALQPELGRPSNLSGSGGSDPHAAQLLRGTPARAVVSPLGALVWTQHRAPFGVALDLFEGQPLAARQSLTIAASAPATAPVQDWFSPGSFAALSQSEALNRPSFERLGAGLALSFGDDGSSPLDHPYTVIEIRLPEPARTGLAVFFAQVTMLGVLDRTGATAVRTTVPSIGVGEETFVVRGTDGSVLTTASSQTDAHQKAKALGGYALPVQDLVVVAGI